MVEALSNYNKSYLWWYGHPACGDSTGSTGWPVWGKRGKGVVWFSVCGAPLSDWANGRYVDVLFTCGECGFSSFRSWYCSEERYGIELLKLCCIARGASNHSAFTGKRPTVISLIHPKDGLSFKEMRMWGQSKISSCCICDWCESREMGDSGEPKMTHQWQKASPQIFFQL